MSAPRCGERGNPADLYICTRAVARHQSGFPPWQKWEAVSAGYQSCARRDTVGEHQIPNFPKSGIRLPSRIHPTPSCATNPCSFCQILISECLQMGGMNSLANFNNDLTRINAVAKGEYSTSTSQQHAHAQRARWKIKRCV